MGRAHRIGFGDCERILRPSLITRNERCVKEFRTKFRITEYVCPYLPGGYRSGGGKAPKRNGLRDST
jgi:hypothetical protein